MSASTDDRSYLDAITDRCSGWYLGLSPEKCTYSSQPVKIPMRDGVELAGDMYLPDLGPESSPFSPILIQTCYGRSKALSIFNAHVYAARGYPVLFVSSRGTFGSGGNFDPGRNEQSDSQDIVAWMREQPWYPGTFVTAGASYSGYSQWALLHDPPADCIAAVVPAGMHDISRHSWGTGSLLLQRVQWSETIAYQENHSQGLIPITRAQVLGSKDNKLNKALEGVPLLESVLQHFDGRAPWLKEWLTRPDLGDPYWTPTQHGAALEKVHIPILLVMGWHDLFTRRGQTMEAYKRLRDRGCQVSLTIGPWGHVDASGLKSMPEIIKFLDSHVANTKSPDTAVQVFISGADEWRRMDSWPPATVAQDMYLQEGNRLGSEKPLPGVAPLSFTFDPANPTPTVEAGSKGPGKLTGRTDMLDFTTETLEESVEVLGQPIIQLSHFSDTPFVDLSVRLSEVDPNTGVTRTIAEAYQALDPRRDSTPVQLELSDCAYLFRKGTCIRLTLAGGSFPMFARNLGTEEIRTVGSAMRPAQHTIALSNGLSRLTLPVAGGRVISKKDEE